MNQSEKINELAAALAPALGRIKNIAPDKEGGTTYRYKFLSLPALTKHVREVFKDVGVAFTQETISEGSSIGVTTRIVHLSGQWLEYGPLMFHVQGGPQDAGSALTYARRYSLAAAVGLAADEDDDGASAQHSEPHSGSTATGSDTGAAPHTSPRSAPPSSGETSAYQQEAPVQAAATVGDSPSTSPETSGGVVEVSGEGPEATPPANHVHEWAPVVREDLAKKGWEACSRCGKTERRAA